MAATKKHETYPAILDKVAKLLAWYPSEKEMIHCYTEELSKLLRDGICNEGRLIFYDYGNSEVKDEALKKHRESLLPTVLVAQSMQEGLDLHHGLSRFQVILVIPFPYLGNEYIKQRKMLNPGWYEWQTALRVDAF
jgi:ATP-dependent DNA helicase DinG